MRITVFGQLVWRCCLHVEAAAALTYPVLEIHVSLHFTFPLLQFCGVSGRKNWSRSSFFSDHFRSALFQLSFPCLLLWLKKCFFPPFGLEVKLKRVKYATRPVGLHHALALSSSVEPQGFFSFILPQKTRSHWQLLKLLLLCSAFTPSMLFGQLWK